MHDILKHIQYEPVASALFFFLMAINNFEIYQLLNGCGQLELKLISTKSNGLNKDQNSVSDVSEAN